MTAKRFALLEGGGTWFHCALADDTGDFLARCSIPTSAPEETLSQCLAFLQSETGSQPITSVGIACFGPLDLNKNSPGYGSILGTPKPGWEGFNPRVFISDALRVRVAIDTDVAGSALGELRAGVARDLSHFVYITVGTGIGAAVVLDRKVVRGASHFEFGHLGVRRHPDDLYEGCCPFHRDCVSGLACGPAVAARWGVDGSELPEDHAAWELESYYLAELCMSAVYSYAPEAIVLGGGVMNAPGLLERTERKLHEALGAYHCTLASSQGPESEGGLRRPGLADQSALVGAYHMARDLALTP